MVDNHRSNNTNETTISAKSNINNRENKLLFTSEKNTSRNNIATESHYFDLNQQQLNDYNHQQNLKIKTKSIENTLLPLVNQVCLAMNFSLIFNKFIQFIFR